MTRTGTPSASEALSPWTWNSFRRCVAAWFHDRTQFHRRRWLARECPICGYRGMFIAVGYPTRWDARCPECGCRERHRLMHLWITEGGGNRLAGKRILHFAPERAVRRLMRDNPLYETADLMQPGVTHRLDITDTKLPDASFDVVIAHHVLEHIPDDRKAMAEIQRMLKPGGFAVLSVPINATREETWQGAAGTSAAEMRVHYGAEDHVRYYGLDFATRLKEARFVVETYRRSPAEEVRFGLLRDEWITLAHKPV